MDHPFLGRARATGNRAGHDRASAKLRARGAEGLGAAGRRLQLQPCLARRREAVLPHLHYERRPRRESARRRRVVVHSFPWCSATLRARGRRCWRHAGGAQRLDLVRVLARVRMCGRARQWFGAAVVALSDGPVLSHCWIERGVLLSTVGPQVVRVSAGRPCFPFRLMWR